MKHESEGKITPPGTKLTNVKFNFEIKLVRMLEQRQIFFFFLAFKKIQCTDMVFFLQDPKLFLLLHFRSIPAAGLPFLIVSIPHM